MGEVTNGMVRLSRLGLIANDCWLAIPSHFPQAALDSFVVMPDHVHGILAFHDCGMGVHLNAPTGHPGPVSRLSRISPRTGTLAVVIRTYKASVTTLARRARLAANPWQRGLYEHIVRGEADLQNLRDYIERNPLRWELERGELHPPGYV